MADLAIKSLLPDSETCDESAFADCLVANTVQYESYNLLQGSPYDIFDTPCAIQNGCEVLDNTNNEQSNLNGDEFQGLAMGAYGKFLETDAKVYGTLQD